ncbi:hypothetical protein J4429_01670 [Candidatus Pacearchaeota archaeon]|nr:hypothetical protein [Candidatus Pacearchaeota archaeon]
MCDSKMMALEMLVLGIVLILVRMFTVWDIWIVLGALAIIKAIMLFVMPNHCCDEKPAAKRKK